MPKAFTRGRDLLAKLRFARWGLVVESCVARPKGLARDATHVSRRLTRGRETCVVLGFASKTSLGKALAFRANAVLVVAIAEGNYRGPKT